MKTVNVTLYAFSELEKEAKKKALEHFRYINDQYEWWENEYDYFMGICSSIGIRVTSREIYFRVTCSQGDGSCFASKIDVCAFVKGIAEKAWKNHAPGLELDVQPCAIDRRVIALIESGAIRVSMWTEIPPRGQWINYGSENDLYGSDGKKHTRIGEELEKLDKWAGEVLDTLNRYLYRNLEETYDYLTSEEAVQDAIEANEYHFTANGEHADWLCDQSE